MKTLKAGEREGRSKAGSGGREYSVIAGRSIPPCKKFLNVAANKQSLVSFLCNYIVQNAVQHMSPHPDWKLFLAGGFNSAEETKCISSDEVKQASALCSTQEEADSRMLLHAAHANDTFSAAGIQGRIVIKSPDTDVLVLAVHYFPQMDSVKELWIETGVVSRTTDLHRFIPVHDICRSHSPVFIKILPAIHALTGCDSTSAFFGIGKKSVYTMVTDKGAHCFEALLVLGRQDEAVGIAEARKFIACLYDPKGKEISAHISMDILRAKFAAKRDSSLAKLPPCEDSMKQHIRRASW